MEKASIQKDPAFLKYVYDLTEGSSVHEALEQSLQAIDELDVDLLKRIGLQTYAEGKWSIHKILQHLIDWERIWAFRAIIFARSEGTIPVAHDQEVMGKHSNADALSIEHLIEELKVLRQSTLWMFKSFDQAILDKKCVFFEYEMPLHAIGLTVAAHQIHHFKVLEERYFPLG